MQNITVSDIMWYIFFSNSLIQYKFQNGDEFFNIWTPYGIILITRYFLFKILFDKKTTVIINF